MLYRSYYEATPTGSMLHKSSGCVKEGSATSNDKSGFDVSDYRFVDRYWLRQTLDEGGFRKRPKEANTDSLSAVLYGRYLRLGLSATSSGMVDGTRTRRQSLYAYRHRPEIYERTPRTDASGCCFILYDGLGKLTTPEVMRIFYTVTAEQVRAGEGFQPTAQSCGVSGLVSCDCLSRCVLLPDIPAVGLCQLKRADF
ncbi:hypothetical protein BDY19DRAFT_1051784 [Irpex rosettiformis]|uniref:Uncharacterized protein n=1 Tax=Irpex rosettiformis TaxID=378272 RepID=A0ACB8TNB1_9APHY|nr:hypothetical protein BDY19DRAFT_1051784 [Irpex rosettiformis]